MFSHRKRLGILKHYGSKPAYVGGCSHPDNNAWRPAVTLPVPHCELPRNHENQS